MTGDEAYDTLSGEIAAMREKIEALEKANAGVVEMPNVSQGGIIQGVAPSSEGAFSYELGKIRNCRFAFGRIVYKINDQEANTDGKWCLRVPHATPGSATVVKDPSETTGDDVTIVPLFTVSGGMVTDDWRGMPVIPIWE